MLYLFKNWAYDNSYDYVKNFENATQQDVYMKKHVYDTIEENEYIKDNESFNINYNYDELLYNGVNYISFSNGYKNIFAFITRKEYINDVVTKIYYEIDVFQTFMFDLTFNTSFIERKVCSLNEICDYDEGIEIGEHMQIEEVVKIDKGCTYFAMLNGVRDFYVSPEGTTKEDIQLIDSSRPITYVDDVPFPLLFVPLNSVGMAQLREYLIDSPSIVGIVRFPSCEYATEKIMFPYLKTIEGKLVKAGILITVATNISSSKTSTPVSISKNSITDFFPYTYYILSDGECEPLVMKPQYMNTNFTIEGRFALSGTPVERYFPSYYKGNQTGVNYNITNTNVMTMPCSNNSGMEYITNNMASLEQQRTSTLSNMLFSGASAIGSMVSGGGIGIFGAFNSASGFVGGINSVLENVARIRDLELTPSTIKSFGSPSTRKSFNTNSVRLLRYTIQDKYKNRVNNFIDRYGNKYNNYGCVDLKTYKGYLKVTEANISGNIDIMFMEKIKQILGRGVKFE